MTDKRRAELHKILDAVLDYGDREHHAEFRVEPLMKYFEIVLSSFDGTKMKEYTSIKMNFGDDSGTQSTSLTDNDWIKGTVEYTAEDLLMILGGEHELGV